MGHTISFLLAFQPWLLCWWVIVAMAATVVFRGLGGHIENIILLSLKMSLVRVITLFYLSACKFWGFIFFSSLLKIPSILPISPSPLSPFPSLPLFLLPLCFLLSHSFPSILVLGMELIASVYVYVCLYFPAMWHWNKLMWCYNPDTENMRIPSCLSWSHSLSTCCPHQSLISPLSL